MENYELNINNYISLPSVKESGRDPKWNPIPIVGIKDKKIFPFPSCYHAARFLRAKNVHTMARNILKVCRGERNTIRGIRWFFESDYEKYNELIYTYDTLHQLP